MIPTTRSIPLASLSVLAAALVPGAVLANDFPTSERVLYVQECMRENPGPAYEMINKCSCALDRIASEVKHEDYVSMATIVKAMSISGERGNELRDNEGLKPAAKRFRELQTAALKSCFINPK